MPNLELSWRASLVTRWHQNPDLNHTTDYTCGHSARVQLLILCLTQYPSAELMRAALLHDLGEYFTGDIARPTKTKYPTFSAELAEMEQQAVIDNLGFEIPALSEFEQKLLNLADKLDAYLWALHHNPAVAIIAEDWKASRNILYTLAEGCGPKVLARIEEVLPR